MCIAYNQPPDENKNKKKTKTEQNKTKKGIENKNI